MKKDNNTPIPEHMRKLYKIDYDYVEDLTEEQQIKGLWRMKASLEALTGLRFVLETVEANIPTLFVYDEAESKLEYKGEAIISDLDLGDFFNQMDGLITIAIAAYEKGKSIAR
jgi:hypothetical protein